MPLERNGLQWSGASLKRAKLTQSDKMMFVSSKRGDAPMSACVRCALNSHAIIFLFKRCLPLAVTL